MFFLGYFTVPMAVLILIWGILAGAAANINQYWLATAAPKAPDFANGLFLASTNLGTTIGTSVCGLFPFRSGNAVYHFGRHYLYCLCFPIDCSEGVQREKRAKYGQDS